MAKLLFSSIILSFYLQGVFSSCWISHQRPEPDMNSDELYCMYNNSVRVNNGITYESGAPDCDECTCSGTVLNCCKYGHLAGPANIQGCVHVPLEGSCDFNFRQENDVSLPCILN